MTIELRYGETVVAEVTDIIISPAFKDAVKQTATSFDALTQGMISLNCKINDTNILFQELKAQLDRINKPKKPKITNRQIWKALRRY